MALGTPDLGPFALGPKIGGGGMASVYLGKYVASPGEEVPEAQEVVALKVIKGDFVKNAEYEKMFLDEAQILTQLSHPNVIRTLGYGAQAGAWFIAMELLMGRSLLDLWEAASTAKRAIPFDVAAYIALEVARGLEHAHALVDEEDGRKLGIVHRDVNPSNVFVGYDGSVKLIDFGLAKARKRQTKSVEGLIKGKIPYLSPEQILEETLDGRSDVYALGTTLWETVTMRRLFKRDTDVATVRAIQKGEVPDPRTLGLTNAENFPEALWKIIAHALEHDRDKRYADAAALAKDLDAFVGTSKHDSIRGKLAHLVEDLFPGEADKQGQWLSEATGKERKKTSIPFVPLAEVPDVEQSLPMIPNADDSTQVPKVEAPAVVVADTESESETETVAETETASETATDAGHHVLPKSPGLGLYIALGALAGIVVVVAWMAIR